MYIPPAFREDDPAALAAIMAACALPILVSATARGLIATHLPLRLVGDRLIGHIARANPHWRDFAAAAETMAIFTAAEGYVSPSLYATKAEHGRVVPTWNYQAVHAYGRLEIVQSPADILPIVTDLTDHYETPRAAPWAVSDAPDDYIASQLKGIVGVVLHISRLDGKVKLSQNRSAADMAGVVAGLEADNPGLAKAMRGVGGKAG
jgi:transcriptional regulator